MVYYASGYGYAPTTAYNTVKKVWDGLLHEQTQSQLFFKDMIGRDKGGEGGLDDQFTNSPIVEKTQLGKESGDRITMSLVAQNVTSSFYNAGKTGNNQLVDAEKTLTFYNTYVHVSHWRDANAIFGKQTLKMTPFDVMKVAKSRLANEIAKFLDEGIFFTLYAGYSPNVVRQIGTSVLLEKLPLNNVYGKNQSAYANLQTSDVLDTELLEILSVAVLENNINPIKYEGKECHLFICHPRGMKTLRADSLWQDANIHALPANKDNPVFSRASGRWSNIFVAEHNSIDSAKNYGSLTVSSDQITIASNTAPVGIGNNTDLRMNLLLGANSVARAVALPEYMEKRKEDDFGNIIAFGGGLIYGDRRPDFDIDDGSGGTYKNQSSICVYTYSPTVASNFTAIWS
jgi:N4-gp56 family major capsid protein